MRVTSMFRASAAAAIAAVAVAGCEGMAPMGGGPTPGSDAASGSAPPLPPPPPAGGAGATPGGVQDMGLARELVRAGRVPPPEAFVVEGMFSEHDLPVDGPPCERTLCLRSALAAAPTLAGDPSAWLQIGMSSAIDLQDYDRPPLTLIAAVDVSGSMGWDYDTGDDRATPGEVSRALLSELAASLGPEDRIAIVTYGSSVRTPLALTAGDDRDAVQAAIDRLAHGGSTNMEAGLRRAYDLARGARGDTGETRVMLFTDIRPNVGATGASAFEQITSEGAADGVSLTVFGLGVGLRQELLDAMSHLRGGNAFSLFDRADVDELMVDDWPLLASPIAYDFSVAVEAADGTELAEGYGFPDGGGDREASLEASSVFLSRRRGALLVRLDPTGEELPDAVSITGTLAYEERDGTLREQAVEAELGGDEADDRGHVYGQDGIAKAVSLAVFVSSMREAAELYGGEYEAAIELAAAARDRLAADADSLGAGALAGEVEFADALVGLMEAGAEQGDLYARP